MSPTITIAPGQLSNTSITVVTLGVYVDLHFIFLFHKAPSRDTDHGDTRRGTGQEVRLPQTHNLSCRVLSST